jgi:RNA polymerase sigma-70 factor (ECF subfamily)
LSDLYNILRNKLYKSNLIERRCILISNIELLELDLNKPERSNKIMMDNYKELIYTMIYNKLSGMYSKEYIEECIGDVFFEVYNHKNGVYSQNGFIKVFLVAIAKRKVIDIYRIIKNNNPVPTDEVSVYLHSMANDVVRSILLKENNSQLLNATKSLCKPDREIIIKQYHSNQRLKGISKNSSFKVSTYA